MPHKSNFIENIEKDLALREKKGLLRSLEGTSGVDFTSNDYLNYRQSADLKQAAQNAIHTFGVGSGASRLLRGNHCFIEKAEAYLADFSKREAALLFSSGFAANIGIIKALTGPGDLILSDELNHASLIDGIKLSSASKKVFRHQDFKHLSHILESEDYERAFIVTESVFSMDGDLTDLQRLAAIAKSYNAQLIVDEAHATGIYGANGSGRVEELGLTQEVLCTMHTGGKALGVGGAWIASDAPIISHMINHARSFVFSTAPVPALVAGLHAAAQKRRADTSSPAKVLQLAANLRSGLQQAGFNTLESKSQIVPVLLGTTQAVLSMASALQKDGLDVRAIRPPTVPNNTSRLRIALRSDLDILQVEHLINRLKHHAERLCQ